MSARIAVGVVLMAGVLGAAATQSQTPTKASVTTLAFRVHNEKSMVAFYSESFGARFRVVDTNGIRSQFAELDRVTLKFVPIRDSSDFKGFPVHQPGFDVPDVGRVIEIAQRHGGTVQNAPVRTGDRVHAAIRDPDGNTIELYGPR